MSQRTKWGIASVLVLLVAGVIVLGAAKRVVSYMVKEES